ncbi:MAG: hypothetical protein AB1765_03910 [Candidatus Hydrogenedentota bacterium]
MRIRFQETTAEINGNNKKRDKDYEERIIYKRVPAFLGIGYNLQAVYTKNFK